MPEFIIDPLKYFNEEVKITQNPIIDPTSQFVKGTTITGKEAEDYRLASEKYGDFNFTQINPQSVLDARQPWSDVIVNGATQFGARTATSFLGTVGGLITGSTQWLAGGIVRGGDFRTSDFTMDYFSQGLSALDESIAKAMPIYQDPEDTRNWTQQLGDLDFWAGNVLPNLGFTAGAALGVYATAGMGSFGLEGKLLQMAGKSLQGTKLAATGAKVAQQGKNIGKLIGDVAKGFKTEKSLGDLAKATSPQLAGAIDNGVRTATAGKSAFGKQVYGTMVSTLGESKFEAIGTYNELKQELIDKGYDEATADSYAKKAANADFFLNTLILGISNYAQFGHLFGTGKTLKGSLASFIKGDLARGYTVKNLDTTLGKMLTSAPKWAQIPIKVGYAGGKAALGGLREGMEEWSQFMGNKVAKNYAQRIEDGYSGDFGGTLSAIYEGLTEEFGVAENTDFFGEAGENFFLGAIMGALGMPVNLKGKFAGGIIGAYQQETENRKLVADKNKQVQDTAAGLENIRKKYGLDKLAQEIDPEGKMEAADLLNKMRESYGKNQAFRDAMISYSFQKDATDAYEVGDTATAKIMEAMGFAHDLITAETAGRGDEFLSFISSQEPITAQEIRDFTAQQTKNGTVFPFAPLTDEVLEKKVADNKRELTEKATRIKEIHSKVKQIPNLSIESAKSLTTMLAGVDDIEKRFEGLLEPNSELQKLIARMRPKELDQLEEFDAFVRAFLNPSDIKQTLANISNSEDFAKFRVNAVAALTDLMQKGVIDYQTANIANVMLYDLGRSAKTRSDILKKFNKIVEDPENFNAWQEEQKKDTEEGALEKEIGKRMSSIWASNGFAVPENMFEVEQGEFFGKVGENLISIEKTKDKLTLKINDKQVTSDELYQKIFNTDFVPLSKEQFLEANVARGALIRKQKEERIVEEVLQDTIKGLEKVLDESNILYQELLKKKEPLLKKVESYKKDVDELKKEITALAKIKNKALKKERHKDLPTLKELLKETQELIDEISKEIATIDSQIDKVLTKEEETQDKIEFLKEELAQKSTLIEVGERALELFKLAENKNIKAIIESLEKEKQELISIKEDLIELFNDLTEEENLIKLFDTLEAIERRLDEIPALIENLKQNILDEDIIGKARLLEQVRTNIKLRLQKDVKENDKYSSRPNNQVGDVNIKEEFTDSAKKPIEIGFFTTAGNETIEGTDTLSQSQREQRWYGYLNRTSKKKLKEERLLVFSKNSPYNNEAKLGEPLYDSKEKDADLFVLVTDNEGNPIEEEGKYIWTSLHLPTRSKDFFSYPKDLEESQEEVLYNTKRKEFIALRENALAAEKSGKNLLLKITDRSRGISKKEIKQGNNLLLATGYTIKELPLEVALGSKKGQVNSVSFPQSGVRDVQDGSTWTETNLGDPLLVSQNNLSEADAETAFEIIKHILQKKSEKIEGKNVRDILHDLIFVGKGANKEYQIYFGTDSVFIKGTRIDRIDIDEYRDEIITFLKKKRYNVNKSNLDRANKALLANKNIPKFYKPIVKNGVITFEEYTSYKHFLVENALKVYAPNVGESPTLNKYLMFEPEEKTKPSPNPKDIGGPILDTVTFEENIEPTKVESNWKSIQEDFNIQAKANGITTNKSKKEDTFAKALNNIIETSSSAAEIDLAQKALEKLTPVENKPVEKSENISNLDADSSLKAYEEVFGLPALATEEQSEKGKEQREECNGNNSK